MAADVRSAAQENRTKAVATSPYRDELEGPELTRAGDRLAARGNAELSVRGDRLGLDRVPGDLEPLGHFTKREMRGQERQQEELGARQSRLPARVGDAARLELPTELRGQLGSDPEVPAVRIHRIDVIEEPGGGGQVAEREHRPRKLEPRLDREPRQCRRQLPR